MQTTKRHSSRASIRNQQQTIFDREGRLHIQVGLSVYAHPKSPLIWADFRLGDGQRKRESAKTTNLELAITWALRRAKELEQISAAGRAISVRGPNVGDIVEDFISTLKARLADGDMTVKPAISVLRRNFLPYWKQVGIGQINRQTFYAWEEWRERQNSEGRRVDAYQRGGRVVEVGRVVKPPQKNTLLREKNYFVAALDWASSQVGRLIGDEVVHEIRHLPRRRKPTVKQRAVDDRRDALSAAQITALYNEFDRVEAVERDRAERLGEAGRRKNYQRRLMALHVRLLLLSGLRPGAEILEITWDRLQYPTNDKGERILVIDQCGNGKTGPRIVNCDPDAVEVIEDLKRLLEEFGFPTTGRALLWPSRKRAGAVKDMGSSFKATMKRLGFSERVVDEPLYILRHTYLTERLRLGVSSDVLAINCGTSHEMIDRHYNHLKAETIRNALRPADPADRLGLKADRGVRGDRRSKSAAPQDVALSILATMGQRSASDGGVATLGGSRFLELDGSDLLGEARPVKLVRENQGGAR